MNIVIIMEGGVIHQVMADAAANVVIVDRDTEGCDLDDIKTVLGEEAYVYHGIKEAEVEPDTVTQVFQEARE